MVCPRIRWHLRCLATEAEVDLSAPGVQEPTQDETIAAIATWAAKPRPVGAQNGTLAIRRGSLRVHFAQPAQRVIMDAANDADHLRAFIADDLGATARIKRNPTRRVERPIDWMPNKERHFFEFFFYLIRGFWRITLRSEKPVRSSKAFVDLACARARISEMRTHLAENPSRHRAGAVANRFNRLR